MDNFEKQKNTDYYHQYISDKVKRITAAAYRVTELFSDKEPLKWYMRKEALFVLRNILEIRYLSDKKKIECFKNIEKKIEDLFVILEFSSFGTFVPKGNFDILEKEYKNLLDFIKDKEKEISQMSFLENTLVDYLKESSDFPRIPFVHKKKEMAEGVKNQEKKEEKENSSGVKRFVSAGIGEENNNYTQGQSFKNTQRRKRIIDLIKQKEEVSVGEIALFFNDLSEKTIQRDLISMSSEGGVLERKGDKRWRKYRISQKFPTGNNSEINA